jgi:hypothetical protein
MSSSDYLVIQLWVLVIITPPGSNFFNAYFNPTQFSFRVKNATEILNDATMVVYYSLDSGSLYDNGPNRINQFNNYYW